MDNFLKLILAFVLGLVLVVVAMPKVIPFLHKMKFGQVEREEGLQSHKVKSGTPTMGGLVFIVASILAVMIVNYNYLGSSTLWLATLMLVGYGAIGFIDDAIIVIKKHNKGLPAWVKYLIQSLLAVVFYFLAQKFVPNFTSEITIPLVHYTMDIGWLYPVLIYFMFTATTNGVNLSDGLDGLATGLCSIAIAPFVIIAVMLKDYVIASYAMAMIGALLGFMLFNYNPAKIFMGDVGSLSLGGFIATLAILTKQEILLVLVGGVFVMETLSVIIQVLSFKIRGKRVFKMAPIHHHFEMLGWSEPQVVLSFWFMGFICGILGIVVGVM
jgi:phospho-N-acetylmuramoyl-pentapeptide-transferase